MKACACLEWASANIGLRARKERVDARAREFPYVVKEVGHERTEGAVSGDAAPPRPTQL